MHPAKVQVDAVPEGFSISVLIFGLAPRPKSYVACPNARATPNCWKVSIE